jgi:hypothetical protein
MKKRQRAGLSKTLARLTNGSASAQRLGLRRPSAALPARDAYVLRKRIVRTNSVSGLDALQDAGATEPRPRERAASWTAAALRRFARARRLRIKEKHSPHEKAPAGWTHSKTLARPSRGPASAQRLGLRRPSAALPARDAYVLRKRIVRAKKRQGAGVLPDAGATDQRPHEREGSCRAAALRRFPIAYQSALTSNWSGTEIRSVLKR